MSLVNEFKKFALRGNVVDLAVGVVIGAAFGKIVSSFTSDILMPPLGMALGKVDFSNLFIALDGGTYPSLAAAKQAGAPTLNYGSFLNVLLDFVIVAFSMFLIVRGMNRLQRAPEPAPVRECPFCLSVIPPKAIRCAHCTSDLSL